MEKWLLERVHLHPAWCCAVAVLLLCTVIGTTCLGQQYFTGETTYGLKLGKTKPLHQYYAIPPTDPGKLTELKKNKPAKFIPNFVGRRPAQIDLPDPGPDPLWHPGQSRDLINITPLLNFEGINANQAGGTPPDVAGDVGGDYYVEAVNATSFRVYNKMGQAVSLVLTANMIWSQVGQSSAGDPILLYDQAVDRWLLTEFAPVNRRRVLLAVSEDGDPRGSWTAYTFQTPQFPDFPKYGIWPDAYYLTTNENGFNFPMYAFNREDMLAGEDTVRMQRLTIPKIQGVFFEVGQPVDWDGLTPPPAGSPGLVVKLNDDAWGTTTEDVIQLSQIYIDWDTAANSHIDVVNIPCSPFDTDGCNLETTGGFSCVPQPNNQGIDGAQWIITNKSMYRNFGTHESFVLAFMVDVTGGDIAGIRWMEFRKTAELDWHIYQEGTVGSDDGIHRFMPSIGIDGNGTIGLAYAVSGYDKHPSLRYTGRFSYDPPGEMTFREYEFATGLNSQGFDRYGDYFTMSVDPSDDATFWFAGQYLLANADWSTRIVTFNANRDTIDISPIAVVTPQSAPDLTASEILTVAIRNQGLKTVDSFQVSFQFNNGEWITEEADIDSLMPDSVYYHTFDSLLHFAALGTYPIRIANYLPEDENRNNDTLNSVINLYARRDIALQYIPPDPDVTICGNQAQADVIIRNIGGDTITTALLELRINGESPVVYTWNGSLAQGEETVFSFLINGLQDGINQVAMTVVGLNNDVDEVPSNNEIVWNYDVAVNGAFITLEFKTDNFPAENSWSLFDENGELLSSGGPYPGAQTIYVTTFCIDPTACYTFTIYDAVGDGIDSGVDGYFNITNIEGDTLAALGDPDFDEELPHSFCISGECMLDVDAAVSHVSAPGVADGTLLASTVNGTGAIVYSIDGGANFMAAPIFNDLEAGIYQLIAVDQTGCSDTVTVEILTCQLQMQITALPANPGDIGEIHVAVTGSNGPVTYALNGGTFQADSFWVMLEPGIYFVSARDSQGCTISDTVMISTVSANVQVADYFIRISPNPGTVTFHIEATLPVDEIHVPYAIVNESGKVIQRGSVVRYNETYRDQFFMITAAPGVYYVVFDLRGKKIVSRIAKV